MWYATRASGYTALVLLSATVAIGLVTSMRSSTRQWPRFVVQSVHRDVSLLVVLFLLIHILTSVLDPFAKLTVLDTVVPFIASYRPLWLGLGVVSIELLIAIIATSLVRHRLSWRTWRVVHLLAYISWPIAVVHGIGTGSDTKSAWALLLVTVCVAVVVGALVWRLTQVGPRFRALGWAGILGGLAGTAALVAWMAVGPLQPGWAKAAGTPADLLAGSTTRATGSTPAPVHVLTVGLSDGVRGVLARTQTSVTATMVDTRDTTLNVVIVAGADGSGHLSMSQAGTSLCDAPASVGTSAVTAQCGTVLVNLQLVTNGSAINGTMTTRRASVTP
jgi:methionine sulfoxide reductase heme-binding subunit